MLLCIKYIFVHRLVSAYVNKVVNHPNSLKSLSTMKDKSFSSFVNHVLKEYKESDCYHSYNLPCFAINEHWRPFNARCSYCDIPYNVIGRLETLEEDVRYILLKQNLTHIIPLEKTSIHAQISGE